MIRSKTSRSLNRIFTKKVGELKQKVSSNQQSIAALQQQQESLMLKYEKLNGENFDTNNTINNMEERLASSEETSNRLQEQLEEYKEKNAVSTLNDT